MRKTLWRVAAIAAAASIWLAPSSAAQSRRPEDLVDAFVAAWNSHDVNAFERLFAADADIMRRAQPGAAGSRVAPTALAPPTGPTNRVSTATRIRG